MTFPWPCPDCGYQMPLHLDSDPVCIDCLHCRHHICGTRGYDCGEFVIVILPWNFSGLP